jgi:ERCC4-type nuclease
MWTLHIDYREAKLIEEFKINNFNYSVENLTLGDIVIKNDNEVKCLFERKTINDYISSIVDGRLKNQSMRLKTLKEENSNIIIIYLIEGLLPKGILSNSKYSGGVTADSLHSSIIGKIIRDNFYVYMTPNIVETAYTIGKFLDKFISEEKLNKKTNLQLTNSQLVNCTSEYAKTIKLEKKANMTPKMCYICQLSQIPSFSVELAEKIYNVYPSFVHLMNAYNLQITQKGKRKLLESIDGIGKTLSERCYEYLFQINTEPELQINNKQDIINEKTPLIKIKIKGFEKNDLN